MITLNASGGSITFTFDGNSTYLNDGTITVPVNSLALIIDESDMATFRKAASNDIFVSANIAEFGMTKAELESWFKENAVGSTGGGGADTVDGTSLFGGTHHANEGTSIKYFSQMFEGQKPSALKFVVGNGNNTYSSAITITLYDTDYNEYPNTLTISSSGGVVTSITEANGGSFTGITVDSDWVLRPAEGYFFNRYQWLIKNNVLGLLISPKDGIIESGSTTDVIENGIYKQLQRHEENIGNLAISAVTSTNLSFKNESGITLITNASSSALAVDDSLKYAGKLGVYVTGDTYTTNLNSESATTYLMLDGIKNVDMWLNQSYTGTPSGWYTIFVRNLDNANDYYLYENDTFTFVTGTAGSTFNYDSSTGKLSITCPSGISSINNVWKFAPKDDLTNADCFIGLVSYTSNEYTIQDAIDNKVDTSDVTTAVTSGSTDAEIPSAKAVYDAIQEGGGGSITIDPTLDSGSTNAVANSAITNAINEKVNISDNNFSGYSHETSASDTWVTIHIDSNTVRTLYLSGTTGYDGQVYVLTNDFGTDIATFNFDGNVPTNDYFDITYNSATSSYTITIKDTYPNGYITEAYYYNIDGGKLWCYDFSVASGQSAAVLNQVVPDVYNKFNDKADKSYAAKYNSMWLGKVSNTQWCLYAHNMYDNAASYSFTVCDNKGIVMGDDTALSLGDLNTISGYTRDVLNPNSTSGYLFDDPSDIAYSAAVNTLVATFKSDLAEYEDMYFTPRAVNGQAAQFMIKKEEGNIYVKCENTYLSIDWTTDYSSFNTAYNTQLGLNIEVSSSGVTYTKGTSNEPYLYNFECSKQISDVFTSVLVNQNKINTYDAVDTLFAQYETGSTGGGISSAQCQTLIDQSISGKTNQSDFNTYSAATDDALALKLNTSAITTSITSGSTDSEIPTAKAVYDYIDAKFAELLAIIQDNEEVTAQALNDLNNAINNNN